jgi:hypothetical protein
LMMRPDPRPAARKRTARISRNGTSSMRGEVQRKSAGSNSAPDQGSLSMDAGI